MSLWRSKRRYDTGRRIGEQADEALYALALLQTDQAVTKNRPEEIREKLGQGEEILKTLRAALMNPEEVDSYTYTVARRLRENYGEIDEYAIQRLNRYIQVMREARNDISYYSGLEEVGEMLEIIEDIAERTSEREVERMRRNVAHSDS